MPARLPNARSLIACLALLPVLAGCNETAVEQAPLSEEARASIVVDDAGAADDRLAREIDDLFTKPGMGETRAVVLMYGGQVVEHAPVRELFGNPKHPYTQALLTTVPSVRGERKRRLTIIEGQPPILGAAPQACPFRDRCPHRMEVCDRMNPQRIDVGNGHDVACFLADEGLTVQQRQPSETAAPLPRAEVVPEAMQPGPQQGASQKVPAASPAEEARPARAQSDARREMPSSVSHTFKIGGD